MEKTAVIDIDNTLWQFSDALYRELRRTHEAFPPPDRWERYDPWEGYCPFEDFRAAIERVHRDQDSERHLPYPESREFLDSLRRGGFRLVIASHRAEGFRQPTANWLQRHGLGYDDLHLSFDKSVLFDRAAVVVDDSPLILAKALAKGVLGTGLLFPWNRACAANGLRLFSDLLEVRDYIFARQGDSGGSF